MTAESRRKEEVRHRRQDRKRLISLMARKGKKAFRGNSFWTPSRFPTSYLCGPCSRLDDEQVRHTHRSKIGRRHFGGRIDEAYKLPLPKRRHIIRKA